jgi:catechol 2,3-dioxygenase-like lactoylglutathione lyase family enzyme
VRIGSIILNVSDTSRAEEFWMGALGYVRVAPDADFLRPASGDGPLLHFDSNDVTHVDLWVDGGEAEQASEVERLVALGATRVDWDYPDNADFVVLADPDGTLFCVVA